MRVKTLVAVALAAAMMPAAAMADDPRDATMSSSAARERDRQIIRQLNREELARVRARDARWAAESNARAQNHQRAMSNYARDRAQYEREMAAWRRAVAACRAGDHSACRR